jgi:hypothetical protein
MNNGGDVFRTEFVCNFFIANTVGGGYVYNLMVPRFVSDIYQLKGRSRVRWRCRQ